MEKYFKIKESDLLELLKNSAILDTLEDMDIYQWDKYGEAIDVAQDKENTCSLEDMAESILNTWKKYGRVQEVLNTYPTQIELEKEYKIAKAAYEKAKEIYVAADRQMQEYEKHLCSKILDIDEDCLEISHYWECSKSPVGSCVYNIEEDCYRDNCLFCHEPEERK